MTKKSENVNILYVLAVASQTHPIALRKMAKELKQKIPKKTLAA